GWRVNFTEPRREKFRDGLFHAFW
ncbi:MAG: hypothetical protein AVDCRST_MAG22-2983, partial [uncultured Rubrobacteraceae bacterium]